jgi:hypothetical protein
MHNKRKEIEERKPKSVRYQDPLMKNANMQLGDPASKYGKEPLRYEYKTTYGKISWDHQSPQSVPDPIEPDGIGWKLVSSAIDGSFCSYIFWFWQRQK